MLQTRIGIIGHGFVGEAIASSVIPPYELIIRDPAKGFNATYDELKMCEAIFVCVPSPADLAGNCDTSILEDVVSQLKDYTGVIISKVTAPPSVYEDLASRHNNLVYIPEFLTAEHNITDYQSTTWSIVGGEVGAYVREAARIIKFLQPGIRHLEFCSIGEASLIKYIINTFLATKVIFMNDMHQLAEKHGYNWRTISTLASMDKRIGDSHMKVPGPDGQYGFGGMCFPKDTSAIANYAKSLGIALNVLESAIKKNTLLRLTEPK
jgi:UDPglucose 6-dehydrogenase